MTLRKPIITALSALVLFVSNSAYSATATYDYTATVTGSGVGVSGIDLGDTVTGTLSYSNDYPASTFTASSALYDATGAILTMNGASAGLDRLQLANSSAVPDRFNISKTDPGLNYFLNLTGTNALIQDARVIPLDLDFNNVTTSQVAFGFLAGSGFGEGQVTATLTSFTVQAVPLPGAAWLLLSGLAGMLITIRRNGSTYHRSISNQTTSQSI